MTGQEVAGCLVIERCGNIFGSATWRVVAACGHAMTVLGTRLRHAAKTGAVVRCAGCREHRGQPKPEKPAHGRVRVEGGWASWDPRPLWVRALEARGQEVRFDV